ncbi:MAG: zinc metalloprotease HtpX [Solirubrobacteraceae bacterium]
MNITHTRTLTRLRTWTLVAGLTALVIALGALIGGVFAWLFAAIAIGANVIGYFYSDRIALRAVRAQPLTEAQAPEVHATVRALSARAGIPMPRLYLMPGEQPNAFATGRNPHHAAVAVTEGLLVSLPLEQVSGVLAHELSHIKNRDILVSSVAATIAGAISAIVNILQLSFLFGGIDDEDNPLGLVGVVVAMVLAPLAAILLQLGVSRQREYLADASAAQLLGTGAPLANALEEIARDRTTLQVSPVSAPMYIINPLSGASASSLFSTHPPVRERIRRLRAYDLAPRANVAVLHPHHAGRRAA